MLREQAITKSLSSSNAVFTDCLPQDDQKDVMPSNAKTCAGDVKSKVPIFSGQLQLTLARVGGAEGYCNRFVCLFVCRKITNIGTLKILPADVKSYKDQK